MSGVEADEAPQYEDLTPVEYRPPGEWDERPFSEWSDEEIRGRYGKIRANKVIELERELDDAGRQRMREVLLPGASEMLASVAASLKLPKFGSELIQAKGALLAQEAMAAYVGTRTSAFESLAASVAEAQVSRTSLARAAFEAGALGRTISQQLTESMRPTLGASGAIAAHLAALSTKPSFAAALAKQVAQGAALSAIATQHREQLLGTFDAVIAVDGIASGAAVAAARQYLERIEATSELVDADTDDLVAPDDADLAPFVAALIQRAQDAMTDRNLVVATVYLVVLSKTIELLLLAGATGGLITGVMSVSCHSIARRSAQEAGKLYDRLAADA